MNEEKRTWQEEGSEGFTIAEAMEEAQRCLHCPKPLCRTGCPIENEIPDFIQAIAKGNFGEAAEIIGHRSNLPTICGRCCPKELQCEGHCILNKAKKPPIQIGKLESFVGQFMQTMPHKTLPRRKADKGRIAVVGSGPAGLTVAGDMAKLGYEVSVFEESHQPGGILAFGIPEFRLSKTIVRREIEALQALGVQFFCDTTIGEDKTIDDLWQEGFDAIFLGTGTTVASTLNIPGMEYQGISYAMELLTAVQTVQNEGQDPIILAATTATLPVQAGEKVLVIGGGNVAMDASRTAKRLGCDTTVVYRRGQKNMTSLPSEYEEALEDGVQFTFYSAPHAIEGQDGKVTGLTVEKQEILEDGSMVATGIVETIPADKIIIAIGYTPNATLYDAGITTPSQAILADAKGYITTEEVPYFGMTSRDGVFAAGDVVHRPATVVLAMKEAKRVAPAMDAYVQAKKAQLQTT